MDDSRHSNRVPLIVRLEKDAEDYPPFENEQLWCFPLGEGLFRVENIPLFARGLAWGDLVTAEADDDQVLRFQGRAEPSGHSTFRLFVKDRQPLPAILERFERLGCRSETAFDKLVALDVPPTVAMKELREVLEHGREQGQWEYEEACLFHPPEGYAEAQKLWALMGIDKDSNS
jgi:hypothetical protein